LAAPLGAGWLVGPGPAGGGAAGGPVATKAAVTLRSAPMETSHAPVPAHAPDQPAKAEPPAARATRRTTAPGLKPWRQSVGHQNPAGELSTEPVPVPAVAAFRRTSAARGVPLKVMRCRRSLPVSATTRVLAPTSSASPCGAMNCPVPVPSVPITSHVPGPSLKRRTRLAPVSAT
jgi:hypothetical protein